MLVKRKVIHTAAPGERKESGELNYVHWFVEGSVAEKEIYKQIQK